MNLNEYEHFARLHEQLVKARAALDELRFAIMTLEELRGAASGRMVKRAKAKLYKCERQARLYLLSIWRWIDRLESFRDNAPGGR
jgi:hypothetical protein